MTNREFGKEHKEALLFFFGNCGLRQEFAPAQTFHAVLVTPFSFRKRKYKIPVIRELKSEDAYAAIFVVMRYTQLDGIIPGLVENTSKNIIHIGNNLSLETEAEKYLRGADACCRL